MNRSLDSGMVPNSWKEARVATIFKSECPTNPSNYRPISILPLCMKLFERAVQMQLVSYLTQHDILCKEQSGFRKLHSTQTALIDITNYVYRNMDNGNLIGAVYIDLKKAFDTVDIETLLFKLKCLGIRGTEFMWFENYLQGRRQCVQHGAAVSEKLNVTCGVPQGSILGPILFTIYVNDVVLSVKNSKTMLYADDTVLLYSAKSQSDIKKYLSEDLVSLTNWFTANKLHLNIKKCKWTLFGSQRRLQQTSKPEIKINNEEVEHVDSYKYLGVQLDKTLNFEDHIESLCKKLRQRLGVLRRVRDYVDQDTALKLYNALVMPLIDYCDVTYTSSTSTCISKVDRLMMKGGRIVLNVPYDTPTIVVLDRLKWLTFKERILYHKQLQMYKCRFDMSPNYLSSLFEKVDHGYDTRLSDTDLKLPRCFTNMGQKAFSYCGASLWNTLSNELKASSSLDVFKRKLLQDILLSRQ